MINRTRAISIGRYWGTIAGRHAGWHPPTRIGQGPDYGAQAAAQAAARAQARAEAQAREAYLRSLETEPGYQGIPYFQGPGPAPGQEREYEIPTVPPEEPGYQGIPYFQGPGPAPGQERRYEIPPQPEPGVPQPIIYPEPEPETPVYTIPEQPPTGPQPIVYPEPIPETPIYDIPGPPPQVVYPPQPVKYPPEYPPGVPECPPTVPVCETSSRRYFLGFSQDAVAAGAQVLITARPQYLVRFDRLFIPSNIGQFFDLNNLTIGNVNQSIAAGANSGVVFSEVGTYVELGLDTAYPGIDIVLTVTNIDAQPRNFRASLFGVLVA